MQLKSKIQYLPIHVSKIKMWNKFKFLKCFIRKPTHSVDYFFRPSKVVKFNTARIIPIRHHISAKNSRFKARTPSHLKVGQVTCGVFQARSRLCIYCLSHSANNLWVEVRPIHRPLFVLYCIQKGANVQVEATTSLGFHRILVNIPIICHYYYQYLIQYQQSTFEY